MGLVGSLFVCVTLFFSAITVCCNQTECILFIGISACAYAALVVAKRYVAHVLDAEGVASTMPAAQPGLHALIPMPGSKMMKR